MSKLIRVVQGGKTVREYAFTALIGQFFNRIEKAHGTVEISDPELEDKLTESELKQLYAKFPEIDPNRKLPPKPSEEPVKFREKVVEPKEQEDAKEEKETVQEKVSFDEFVDGLTDKELVEWMQANEIDFDGRKKKNREYLIEQITTA